MKTFVFARAIAARAAAKYAAPSIRKARRDARSMRQQLRPGTSRLGLPVMSHVHAELTRGARRCCEESPSGQPPASFEQRIKSLDRCWRERRCAARNEAYAAAALPSGRRISSTSAVLATSAYLDAMSKRFTACEVALRS